MKRIAIKCFDEEASIEIYGRNGEFYIDMGLYEDPNDSLSMTLTIDEAMDLARYIERRAEEMAKDDDTPESVQSDNE